LRSETSTLHATLASWTFLMGKPSPPPMAECQHTQHTLCTHTQHTLCLRLARTVWDRDAADGIPHSCALLKLKRKWFRRFIDPNLADVRPRTVNFLPYGPCLTVPSSPDSALVRRRRLRLRAEQNKAEGRFRSPKLHRPALHQIRHRRTPYDRSSSARTDYTSASMRTSCASLASTCGTARLARRVRLRLVRFSCFHLRHSSAGSSS
jgi:hypothetical protein